MKANFFVLYFVKLEYSWILHCKRFNKRKNRVNFKFILQNVNEVLDFDFTLCYNTDNNKTNGGNHNEGCLYQS